MELKQVSLLVDAAQFRVILAGLDELAGKVSRTLYSDLCSQVEKQLREASEQAQEESPRAAD